MPSIVRRTRPPTASCPSVLRRFIAEDGGQDLVEYAFLAAFIGTAGWAVLMTIPETMGETYASWLSPTAGVPALWDPPEPGAGGS